jgi:cysteine desulfurase / selenocysteine lyase
VLINTKIQPLTLGSLYEKITMHSKYLHVQNDLDIKAIRKHFLFTKCKRIITNNAATTQLPVDLLKMQATLARDYENVHRGQSKASQKMTSMLESAYQTIASFLNAPNGQMEIALYRNTTEAINSVMYSLLTEFKDGDNVVTTMMEHNSNYVPCMLCAKKFYLSSGLK